MKMFIEAIRVELLKARRSRMPLITALGFLMIPLVGGFLMIILRDPEAAKSAGLISTKAQLTAGASDWPAYLSFLAQATAVGGFMLFGMIASWVFGREYSDHTFKDILALPTPRWLLALAKFIVVAAWCISLVAIIMLVGLGVGKLVALPAFSATALVQGVAKLAVVTILIIVLVLPLTYFACVGRGYLPPIGVAIFLIVVAQITAATGWGEYFPWAIPALHADLGRSSEALRPMSFLIVFVTGAIGLLGTMLWWERADHPY